MGTGIIGHWPLDANHVVSPTAKDISRFGNDGTCTDVSLTTGIHGETDGASLFNGTTSMIDTGVDMIGIKPLTVEAWIYPTEWGESGQGRILDNGKVALRVSSIAANIFFFGDYSNNASSASASVALNNWYHVMVTRNAAGDETNIYINGVLSGSADQDSGTPAEGPSNVFIGNNDTAVTTFDGKIAKVRVYSFIMSAGQVADLYQSYSPIFGG